jgi:hypothetical protein
MRIMKFHLLMNNRTRWNPSYFQGQQTVENKKEFLQVMGKIYDAVRDNPNLISSVQVMTYKNKDGC